MRTFSLSSWPVRITIAVVILVVAIGVFLASAPSAFPHRTFTVRSGESTKQIANDLSTAHVVRSKLLFRVAVSLLGKMHLIYSGVYQFDVPQNAIQVAWRMTHGEFNTQPVKITIPEGYTNDQIATLMAKSLPNVHPDTFLIRASAYEGYLFPDTYLFLPDADDNTVIDTLTSTFTDRFNSVRTEVKAFENLSTTTSYRVTDGDVVKVASLVEKEAVTTADRKIVAGIIWKRLQKGIPLSLDSPFMLIDGKNSDQLTTADLKTDSPYNLYIHAGLPPTPIDNPGLNSLTAAVEPTQTAYLYFLSDKNGVMHYAKTLAQHNANKALYLGK
jgi:UPF0755 protein